MTAKRFAQVNPGSWGRWRLVCVGCVVSFDPSQTAVFADTQGRPFKDYYCKPCADRLTAAQKAPERCGICSEPLDVPGDPLSTSCGGDCVRCVASFGDPDCEEMVRRVNAGVDSKPVEV
jgi:hypothetical protein